MKPSISIVLYASSPESLHKALTGCGGFDRLTPASKVLIKPNLVTWGDDKIPIAPYGVVSTTRLAEDLIVCLKDFGCSDIAVGEGPVALKKEMGAQHVFDGLGYTQLSRRYGIKLIDFNKSRSRKFAFHDDLKLHIAEEAVENDFFINLPVLKTHSQTKVSLGLKNLKGCLKLVSKKLCHHPTLGLEYCFSFIPEFIGPSLTIVDGIYALERGALHFGNAYRKDVIVASTDSLGADLAAARLIGYSGEDISHFVHFAARNRKSLHLDGYHLVGEDIDSLITPLEWDWPWDDDNTGPAVFKAMGIEGPALPKYDESVCTGCSLIPNLCNLLVMSAFKGKPLPRVEILYGKTTKARAGYDQTLLLGNCMIKANKENPNIDQAVAVEGCPPGNEDIFDAFRKCGLDINEAVYFDFMKKQGGKYNGKKGYDPSLFTA